MQPCPKCGEENSDRARFCSACGSSLETAATPSEERKVVSILFVDLVGFTARSDRADPEDVRATLRPYHERLKQEIERFGGTVEKFVGDAVMAVFGAPVAHEDDAERAVRAALRITEAIGELNEESPGLELAVRAAVNTGEAVVVLSARPERGEGIVTGDVVNTASRLQQMAPVGGVVVGEATYRSTKALIRYEDLEPVKVKGKAGPIPVWRAVAARSRFGVDVEQRTQVPLIGRDHERALLEQIYGRAVRESSVQLVTVSGEPGVGKTRLVWEFQRFVDDQPELVFWRQGRCLPYGEGITFWALGEILKAHAGILESDPPQEATSKLSLSVENVVEEVSERDWMRSRLAPLVGAAAAASGNVDRQESFAAWRGYLEAVAASRPIVLVFEDLHWADGAMLEFVEHLVDWATDVSMLVLCTARPELYERAPGWGGGKRNSTTISLAPLSSDETARLIAALLDQAVLPAETQAAILDRAGGNPLYAEEFVRMLIDRGTLVRPGATWELAAGREIQVPETVQSLIAARLDTLPSERKSLLHAAAVVGKVFWSGTLADIEGIDEAAVREGLHELARKELIRPARRSSVEGQAEYSFWHLLIRDVAYGQVPRIARAAKHRAVAEWIEHSAGDRVTDQAELLAHHYEQANELARAAGEDVTQIEALARRFLILAGERAARMDALKANAYFERALALTPKGDPDRVRLLLRAARVGWGGGRSALTEDLASRALDEARAQGDRLGEGEAITWLSQVSWFRGDTARQFQLVEEAVRILEGQPPGRELALAYTRAAAAVGLAGRSRECLEQCGKALPLVRQFGLETELAILLQFRGQARCDFGEVAGGIADLREGMRLALEFAPAGVACAAHVNLGDVMWFAEGPAKGQQLYEAGIEIGERRGTTGAANWARMQSMWTRFDRGRWDEVLEIGDGLLAGDADRSSQISVLAETFRWNVLLRRGVHDADDVIESKIVPRSGEIGDGQVVVPAFQLGAMNRLGQGDSAGAIALVEELDERMRGRLGFRSYLLPDSARVCLATGALDLLARLLDDSIEHLTRDANCVLGARAVLAEGQGDPEAATRRYDEAAAAWESFGHPLERGHALLGAGRCLLGVGRVAEAEARLGEAREVFVGLKTRPLVDGADALLAKATALSS